MNNLSLKYRINCKKSKGLCLQLEKLLDDADYYEKALLYDSLEQTMDLVHSLREELDKLWDEQASLYFRIIAEYEDNRLAERLKKRDIVGKRRTVIDQQQPVFKRYAKLNGSPIN